MAGDSMLWWNVALHLDEAQLSLAKVLTQTLDDDQGATLAVQDRIRSAQAILLEIFRMKKLLPHASAPAEVAPPVAEAPPQAPAPPFTGPPPPFAIPVVAGPSFPVVDIQVVDPSPKKDVPKKPSPPKDTKLDPKTVANGAAPTIEAATLTGAPPADEAPT